MGELKQIGESTKMITSAPDEELYVDQYHLESGEEELSEIQKSFNAKNNELTFAKDGIQETTYPSLLVVARTNLSVETFTHAVAATERRLVGNKIKILLLKNNATFTHHLLQQGLLKCDQFCTKHPKKKLKLCFLHSGCYMWISNCCHGSFKSVFRGSIFEIGPHPPPVILKLLYHWSCQTPVANVRKWVKVDNNFLKTFYMYLRASCIAAVHEKYEILGSSNKCIEMGVISLSTWSRGQGAKEVKVDILGVMDYENKKLRLRALYHPSTKDPNMKASDLYMEKLHRILETLKKWVNPKCTIVTNLAIDQSLCCKYGFPNMCQSNDSQMTNSHIMEYLKVVVPQMFQNLFNLLPQYMIQQYLDELVWRETWGQTPSRAFDTLSLQLAEQAQLDGPEDMSVKYTLISNNPHKDWKYAKWGANMRMTESVIVNNSPIIIDLSIE